MNKLNSGLFGNAIWSPDGRYVVRATGGNGLAWTRADGAGKPQPLTTSKNVQIPWSFSPDGKRVAYFEFAGLPQIWTAPIEDEGGQLKPGKPGCGKPVVVC
jgi:Tol biopolymer transport system component